MSEIKVDTLTGKTTANDITVTVGATATMSLEQGLAKSWANYETASTYVLNDSFNYASLTDISAGVALHTFTNVFSNTFYSYVGISNEITTGASLTSKTTSTCRQISYNSSNASADTTENSFLAHGDLA